jgi:hypothetical protein
VMRKALMLSKSLDALDLHELPVWSLYFNRRSPGGQVPVPSFGSRGKWAIQVRYDRSSGTN